MMPTRMRPALGKFSSLFTDFSSRPALPKSMQVHAKMETRRLFEKFANAVGPRPTEIEYLERSAKEFESLDEFLALVPALPVLTNFATSIWEFAKGVEQLKSFPWNISIPVADLCNARCTFCTSWLEGRKVLDLKQLEIFEPVIKRAMFVGLIGHGEPMAHPRFDKLCERLHAMLDPLSSCYTITNGSFLHKWRDQLPQINLQSYSISLNAATAETHDEVMGLGRDAFPRIVEQIRELIKNFRPSRDVYITMVVTKQNIAEIPAFIELGNTLGVTEIVFRSLLPQASLIQGLNYHVLPPYDHPDFEKLRTAAIKAIAASVVPVQADPTLWGTPIFSGELSAHIKEAPPAVVSREDALHDRDLRRSAAHLYDQPKGVFRGQSISTREFAEAKWSNGRLYIVTPQSDGAYAATLDITVPADTTRRHLKVSVDADCQVGMLGLGLLDVRQNSWLQRVQLPSGTADTIVIEAAVCGQPIKLLILNGGSDKVRARGSIGDIRIEIEGTEQSCAANWTTLTLHNRADPLDDGTNPLGRVPRFGCKAVYYNLYINEMFYRMNPCCYLQRVPGYEEVRFDGALEFADAWNSPAMVALRQHLRDGPLYGACVRCPEKW